MPLKKLRDYLDREEVRYVCIQHSPAYTMSEVAHEAHICGKEVAKTVMIRIDGRMAMAVVPSSERIDVDMLRRLTGAEVIEIVTEADFVESFPGCEVGAMPPFGNLFGFDVYVATELGERERIAFNAGTHSELIQLPYEDFERLVRPRVLAFAVACD